MLVPRMWASTALEHSLSMTLSLGAYPRVLGREDVFESGNQCSIILGWHGADKDDIEVINIGHKHVLHVAE